jgi:hypothetical protein
VRAPWNIRRSFNIKRVGKQCGECLTLAVVDGILTSDYDKNFFLPKVEMKIVCQRLLQLRWISLFLASPLKEKNFTYRAGSCPNRRAEWEGRREHTGANIPASPPLSPWALFIGEYANFQEVKTHLNFIVNDKILKLSILPLMINSF